jgi:hypothetical protein
MQFVQIRERTVYEMVFETDEGDEISFEIDDITRRRFIDAMNGSRIRDRSTSQGKMQVEYEQPDDPNDIMLDMNDRLAALGLPVVGEEEADGIDQL